MIKFYKYLPYIILYFISFSILVLSQLLEAHLDTSRVTSSTFLFEVIIPGFINLLILLNTVFMFFKIIVENNEKIKFKQKEIDDTLRTSVDVDLSVFLYDVKNRNKKINAYKRMIQKKIDKLNKSAKTDDLIIWNSNDDESKGKNKYCIKMQQLKDSLDDQFINKNIIYLSVDYRPIKESEIKNGYRSKNEDDDDLEDLSKAVIWDIMPGYLQTFLFSSAFIVLVLNTKEISLITALIFTVRLFASFLNFFNGKKYVENVLLFKKLNNLDKIIDILKEYLHWKIKKGGVKLE